MENSRRELPSRAARQDCLNQLFAREDEFYNIEVDDVANTTEPSPSPDVDDDTSSDIPSDETLDSAVLSVIGSDSEDSDEEDTETELVQESELTSADGHVWHQEPAAAQGRAPVRNIFRGRSTGSFRPGLHPRSRAEAFAVVTAAVLEETLRQTNKAGRVLARLRGMTWKTCSLEELQAFIGLHFIAGAFKAYHRDTRELFSIRDGIHLFRATMSHGRFCQLKCALRFDDPARRDREDKLAPIRYITDLLKESFSQLYTPGPYLTVDEMLVEFHGRVSFQQYIPTKPGKFGIKIFWLVDAENSMPLSFIVYIGAASLESGWRVEHGHFSEAIVMQLSSR